MIEPSSDPIQKAYNFFKQISVFSENANSSITHALKKNLTLIKPLIDHFDKIQEKYLNEFNLANNFKKLVDFDFAWLVINNFLSSDLMNDIEIESYDNFEAYEPNASDFTKQFLSNNIKCNGN